jgi:hypothetical protein
VNETVLIFSRDPGGANAVIPLVAPLRARGYRVPLFGKDIALSKYAASGLAAENIMEHVDTLDLVEIGGFLEVQNPDFIITGTSADDMTEKLLWNAAEKRGIPCFAILDQWVNYGVRFSAYSVSELAAYYRAKKHDYLPTKILVMDEFAKRKMVEEGLDSSRIIVTGQPHFENVFRALSRIDGRAVREARMKLGQWQGERLVLFASEPISATYHETDQSAHFWGYTERTILRSLVKALAAVTGKRKEGVRVVIRPHPKENRENFSDIVAGNEIPGVSFTIDDRSDSLLLIAACDLVCGMSSMVLIEAAIAGKAVLSVQIGLCRENPFVLDEMGVSKSVMDMHELEKRLAAFLDNKGVVGMDFRFEREPVDKVINAMEVMLCRN